MGKVEREEKGKKTESERGRGREEGGERDGRVEGGEHVADCVGLPEGQRRKEGREERERMREREAEKQRERVAGCVKSPVHFPQRVRSRWSRLCSHQRSS